MEPGREEAAGHAFQQSRRIGHPARQGAGMVEGPGERLDALQIDKAEARLQPHHPAIGSRDADRSARIRADRAEAEARAHGGGRAAAGAARGARGIPGIVGLAVVRMDRAIGVFQQVRLADEHGPGLPQIAHQRGILGGMLRAGGARGEGRGRAGDGDQVLDRHRHAMQGAMVDAGGQLALGCRRLGESLGLQQGDEGIELAVEGLDPRQRALRHLDGRERLPAIAGAELGDGKEIDLAHGSASGAWVIPAPPGPSISSAASRSQPFSSARATGRIRSARSTVTSSPPALQHPAQGLGIDVGWYGAHGFTSSLPSSPLPRE